MLRWLPIGGFFEVAFYRLYRLDGAGRISTAEWLEAEDDVTAEARAKELSASGDPVELWARNCLIARLAPPAAAI